MCFVKKCLFYISDDLGEVIKGDDGWQSYLVVIGLFALNVTQSKVNQDGFRFLL